MSVATGCERKDGQADTCCPYGWVKWPLAVGGCLLVGIIGALSTVNPNLDGWYGSLNRPSFAPPNSVFGPVWTVLYVTMGLCAAAVWRRGLKAPGVRTALILFLIQLLLNGVWSPLFFGAHRIGWALVDIVLLWIAIGWTLTAFLRVSRAAGLGLIPYWAWVSFATLLNAGYWWLNR
jgi:tryptophan-rich sensory protein